jgi:hypothetical protein
MAGSSVNEIVKGAIFGPFCIPGKYGDVSAKQGASGTIVNPAANLN